MAATETKPAPAVFQEHFAAREEALSARGGPQLHEIRRRGLARFVELGFPTFKDEDWRQTPLAPVLDVAWTPAEPPAAMPSPAALRPFLFGDEVTARLVFVNGCFSPSLSFRGEVPDNVFIGSLAEALSTQPDWVREHLAQQLGFENQPFAALNTAFIADGAAVYVPRGVTLPQPVHLLFLSSGDAGPSVAYPRSLVVVEESAGLSLVEHYASLSDRPTLTNAASEVVCGENSRVDHYKVQSEGKGARHVGAMQARQARGANYTHHSISLGAAWARHDLSTLLAGEGVEALLHGLFVLTGEQLCDHHTRIEHAAPHCRSFELYKGVLDQRARGVFNGRIYVHREAQKTDSKQSNGNLLLSDDAVVFTKPQLEIFADDVKCTHGATIGRLDEDAFFYMRSRGIGREESRTLLIYAFASEVIDRIRIEPLRRQLLRALVEHLPNGRIIKEVA